MKSVYRWCVRCHNDIFYNRVFHFKVVAKLWAKLLGKSFYVDYGEVFL